MKKIIITILIISAIIAVAPLPAVAQGFSLVQCGREGQQQCQLRDLFVIISRMINYLVSLAGLVAMFYIINAGFGLVFAQGNPEKIQSNKDAIYQAVVGLGLVVLSFVLINLLVNGIFGTTFSDRAWWNVDCLFKFDQTPGCPLGPAGS